MHSTGPKEHAQGNEGTRAQIYNIASSIQTSRFALLLETYRARGPPSVHDERQAQKRKADIIQSAEVHLGRIQPCLIGTL